MLALHRVYIACCSLSPISCWQGMEGKAWNGSIAETVAARFQIQYPICVSWSFTALPDPATVDRVKRQYWAGVTSPTVAVFNFGVHMLFRNWTRDVWMDSLQDFLQQISAHTKTTVIFNKVTWLEVRKLSRPPSADLTWLENRTIQLWNDQTALLSLIRSGEEDG